MYFKFKLFFFFPILYILNFLFKISCLSCRSAILLILFFRHELQLDVAGAGNGWKVDAGRGQILIAKFNCLLLTSIFLSMCDSL